MFALTCTLSVGIQADTRKHLSPIAAKEEFLAYPAYNPSCKIGSYFGPFCRVLGYSKGLGIIDGEVKLLKPVNSCLVPHIGWNVLNGIDMDKISIFNDISPDSTCYFVHSYHANIGNNIKRVYTNYCRETMSV